MSATENDTASAAAAAAAAAANKPPGKHSKQRPKKSVGDAANPAAASTPTPSSPTEATHNGVPAEGASEPSKPENFVGDVSKRLKRQAKKLEGIRRTEDKVKDLSPEEIEITKLLTDDERRKLRDKPIVQAVHRELQEVHDRLAALAALAQAEERLLEDRLAEQKHFYEAKLAKMVHQAQDEARCQVRDDMFALGNEKVNTLLKFLRLAGYRRSVRSENVQEDEAIEQVLVLVYSGDNAAMEACVKLAEGSLDPVGEEHIVSFARVKQLAHDLHLDDEDDQEEVFGGINGGGPSPDDVPASTEQPSALTMNDEASSEAVHDGPAIAADTAAAAATTTTTTTATTTPATTTADLIATTTTASATPVPTPTAATSPSASTPADANPSTVADPVDSGDLADGWVKVQDETPVAGEGQVLAESTGNAQPDAAAAAEPKASGEPGEPGFRDVDRRRGGRGGRSRRSRGFRGDRGGGEHYHRGNGEHHHRRGSGEHRGGGDHRGDGEYHRGGGEHRRGGGEHHRGGGEHHRGGGEHHRGGGEHHRDDGEHHHRGSGEHHRGGGEHHRGGGEHHRGGGEHYRGGRDHYHRGGGRGRPSTRRGDHRGEFRGKSDRQQAPPPVAEVPPSS